MYKSDLININEICSILNISRVTLNTYRAKYGIPSIKIKKEVKFSKNYVLNNLYATLTPVVDKINLNMYTDAGFEMLKIDETSYDLRKIYMADGHGAISLLCHLISEINRGKILHLVIDSSNTFLKKMDFFSELSRYFDTKVFWDMSIFNAIPNIDLSNIIKLPIRRLGIVGAHTTIIDDLTIGLLRQGYSEDICSYIGWAMGELADNSATHSKVHPSFIYFEQYGEDSRFLQLTIGDAGIGIPTSLKKNESFENKSDREALLMAFKPYVSGRPKEDRGKGLTDVLKIAMECSSRLRVDSNNISYIFSFSSGKNIFKEIRPLYQSDGTIISILFVDDSFKTVEREDVDSYINECLEEL